MQLEETITRSPQNFELRHPKEPPQKTLELDLQSGNSMETNIQKQLAELVTTVTDECRLRHVAQKVGLHFIIANGHLFQDNSLKIVFMLSYDQPS